MLRREVTTPLQLLTQSPPDAKEHTPWIETLHDNFQEAQQIGLAHFK